MCIESPNSPHSLYSHFFYRERAILQTKLSTLGPVLEVLFKFGANPNERLKGFSVWRYFISMLHASAPCRHSQLEPIVRMFLDAGADPYASCISEKIPVWRDIFHEILVGQKVDGAPVEEALQGISVHNLMEHSSKDMERLQSLATFPQRWLEPHGLPLIIHDLCKGSSQQDDVFPVLDAEIARARGNFAGANALWPPEMLLAPPGPSNPSPRIFSSKFLSSIGERLRPASQSKWPDPESSIGAPQISLGSYQCWEAIGPAKELWDEIRPQIEEIFEPSMGDLGRGATLVYRMIMTGKTQKTARPTIIVSSPRKEIRRQALKLLEQSLIFDAHPGLKVEEYLEEHRLI